MKILSNTAYITIFIPNSITYTDLCNNPMTKEAKLSAAQRIVPEWKDYDAEIKNLMARIDDEQHQEQSTGKQMKKGKMNVKCDASIFIIRNFKYFTDDASKDTHTEL